MVPAIFDLSLFAHVVQTAGILLLCVLFTGLYRLSPRRYFSFWVKGWWFLLVAMLALQLCFRFYAEWEWGLIIYYWGEYCFTFYMFLGALSYPDKKIPDWIKPYQIWLISLVPLQHPNYPYFLSFVLCFFPYNNQLFPEVPMFLKKQ